MEVETYTRSRIHNPSEILSPLAPDLPEAVKKTVNHEIAHADADPKKNSKGGEFGYSAVVVTISDTIIMASWVAWYQPWGEREPEDRMEMAKAPGWNEMSEQDIFVYEQSRKEWISRLREKQQNANEDNPVSILEIIPSREDEKEDEYKNRAKIIIKFSQKLDEMTKNKELPPMDELIDIEFGEIYRKYKDLFNEAYCRAEDEFNWENTTQEDKLPKEDSDVPEEETENTGRTFGIIYTAQIGTNIEPEEYSTLPLAV